MSCCGLVPALRQKLRRRRRHQPNASSSPDVDKAESMTEERPRNTEVESVVVAGDVSTTEEVQVDVEPVKLPHTEYVATGYCGLCRTQLPHNPLPLLVPRTEPWEQWERSCRAVFCLDVYSEADHVVTPDFLLEDKHFDRTIAVEFEHPEWDGIFMQLKVPLLDNHLAYLVHSFCYDVLKSKVRNATPGTIYELAKALSHEASPWETIGTDENGWLDPPSRIGTLIGDLDDEVTRKLQPAFLSRLPAELRAPIWNFVGTRSAYSSFLLVTEETSRLVPQLDRATRATLSLAKGAFLDYSLTNLFGTHYLKRLSNEQTKDAVEIKGDVERIRVIASLPGICALKLIGADWESDWIGKVPVAGQLWYGTLKDLAGTLDVKYTGLTVLDVWHKPPPQLMWDRPDFPAYLVERDQLKDEALWLRWQSASRFEFMRILPLFCGKEAARGLTFYCSDLGITGMASHFSNTTFHSGYRDGMPIYIALKSGEGIKNMWYRLGMNQMDAPSFVIQTTKGRYYHIGPYMLPLTQATQCRWASLNNYSYSAITHIFYQNPRREIFCCGVHGNPTNRVILPRTTYVTDFPIANPPTMGTLEDDGDGETGQNPVPGNGLYLSTAKLDSTRRIQACKVKSRIVGLLLSHEDGTETSLGQWYVEGTNSHARLEVLYDRSQKDCKALSEISFRLKGPEGRRHVAGVDVVLAGEEVTDAPEGEVKVDIWMGQSLAWWFSKDYDDIALWTETYHPVPPEYHVSLDPGS